jgi:3-oxoacyl-(acyl-carrier-protein) synthase
VSGKWVISGAGVISAAGDKPEALHRALCNATPLARAAEGLTTAGIEGFQPKSYIQRRGLRDLSRTSQLACVAASPLATELDGIDPLQVGVILGTAWGSLRSVVDFEWETCSTAPRFLNPLLFAETVANVPAGQVAILFGWSGLSLTVSSGGASGLEAIHQGVDLLEEGRVPMILAGGADELNQPMLRVLQSGGMLAAGDGSLPYDRSRSGIVGGEGAAFLVLESAEHARDRGARPLARLLATTARFAGAGSGQEGASSSDIAAILREMLDRAGIAPADVGLVAAAADGTPADGEEAVALRDVFGDGDDAPLVVAPKAILGETWAASGPLAAVVVLECLRTGQVPGRARRFVPDPYLPPLRMPAETIAAPVQRAVVLARSQGGQVSALLLEADGPA